MKSIIHDVSTNEITEMEMTKAEIAKIKADELQLSNEIKRLKDKEDAKTLLFEKLGLSAEEVALLLG